MMAETATAGKNENAKDAKKCDLVPPPSCSPVQMVFRSEDDVT